MAADRVQRLEQAKRLHRDGETEQAAEIYRQLIEADPRDAEALHLSGVILQQQGRPAEAIARISAAIAIAPGKAVFRANLAVCLRAAGRPAEALAELREAARLEPGYTAGRRNLGVLLCNAGEWKEAAGHLDAALPKCGRDPIALRKLGLARLMLGRTGEAEAVFRQALELEPANLEARNGLAVALKRLSRPAEAEPLLRAALESAPQDADTLTNLGDILNTLGRHEEAVPYLERAASLNPRGVEALNNLAVSLEALERFDEAAAYLDCALAINPSYTPALNNLANDLLRRGRDQEAAACFGRILAIEPRHVPAWYALAARTRHKFEDEELRRLEELVDDPRLAPATRGLLQFGLAAVYDRMRQPEAAMRHALAANQARRLEDAERGTRFDRKRHAVLVDETIRAFPAEIFQQMESSGCESEVPVFVLGMPRSGTTLVEQILSSHPQARGAGELDDMLLLSKRLLGERPAESLPALAGRPLRDAALKQLARYQAIGASARRVVDKTTLNFLHLGLIALLFPKARVIHCLRDARDTCLSCFFHNFASQGLNFTFDLADLGAFHREYERLMRHWRAVLPLRMLDVPYENLVSEPERWSRAMVEFCGLSWDERCLDFHRSERIIQTASAQQVREPVHRRSIGRWQPYAPQLRPLLEALEGRFDETPAVEDTLRRAIALHQKGKLTEARTLYRQVLDLDPIAANAMQLLGLLEHQSGRSVEGLALIDKAVAMQGNTAEFHSNRAAVLKALGRAEEAFSSLETAVSLDPSYAAAWRNLAIVSELLARPGRAEFSWRRLVEVDPSPPSLRGFARWLAKRNRNEEAATMFRRVLAVNSEDADAWSDLGIVLRELELFEESERCHREAIRLAPERATLHLNLGVLFARQERTAEALAAFEKALALDSADADARHNLGAILAAQMRDEEAIPHFRQALELRPLEAEMHNSLGASLYSLGNYAEAMRSFDAALELDPEHGFARFNRAQGLLLRGDWERGFREWAWRWKRVGSRVRPTGVTEWDGSRTPGATLLIYAEQGLGDTLMCLRFIQLARERVGRVIVEVQEPLVDLIKSTPGVDHVIAQGELLPAVELETAMMSLPGIFAARPDAIPGLHPPQFEIPQLLLDRWAERLPPRDEFRIGLGWQGNPRFKRDLLRSIPLAEFAPLARVPGIRWIGLQQGDARHHAKADSPFPIEFLDEGNAAGLRPFLETAAIIRQLDLVITSDTALAHLAGAMAAPVWIALPHVPDWRWLLSRDDSPWYPTARLFRQRARDDWPYVFESMAEELILRSRSKPSR
jgi:tetratricopeptide (TPR) repeat protein